MMSEGALSLENVSLENMSTATVRSAMARWRACCEERKVLLLSQPVYGAVTAEELAFALLLRKHAKRKASKHKVKAETLVTRGLKP